MTTQEDVGISHGLSSSILSKILPVQLRRLNRSLLASLFRQVLPLRAPFPVAVVSSSQAASSSILVSHAKKWELLPERLWCSVCQTPKGGTCHDIKRGSCAHKLPKYG